MPPSFPTGSLPSGPGRGWLEELPVVVDEVVSDWELVLGEPYVPSGECSWVARARGAGGEELVLKVGWRHPEAEHEVDALEHWDGAGAIRCFRTRTFGSSTALLMERCVPGTPLRAAVAERDQDAVIAGLLRRMWAHPLPAAHPFASLAEMCGAWADSFEAGFDADPCGLDPGVARAGIELLRELPAGAAAEDEVLLCTDLHAGNVLSAEREPWLVIDPKPFVGDRAFDAVQHMLNCDARLASDPVQLARRMAGLLEVHPERVRLWLFARCAQEALGDHSMRGIARRLAP
jgi:streptomycin 6-kinase